jgi:plasmid stability protein
MAQILVRNVKPKTIARLKKRAAASGRSLQSEVVTILDQVADEPRADRRKLAGMLEEFRARFKGRKFSDSTKLLREDRCR